MRSTIRGPTESLESRENLASTRKARSIESRENPESPETSTTTKPDNRSINPNAHPKRIISTSRAAAIKAAIPAEKTVEVAAEAVAIVAAPTEEATPTPANPEKTTSPERVEKNRKDPSRITPLR